MYVRLCLILIYYWLFIYIYILQILHNPHLLLKSTYCECSEAIYSTILWVFRLQAKAKIIINILSVRDQQNNINKAEISSMFYI